MSKKRDPRVNEDGSCAHLTSVRANLRGHCHDCGKEHSGGEFDDLKKRVEELERKLSALWSKVPS